MIWQPCSIAPVAAGSPYPCSLLSLVPIIERQNRTVNNLPVVLNVFQKDIQINLDVDVSRQLALRLERTARCSFIRTVAPADVTGRSNCSRPSYVEKSRRPPKEWRLDAVSARGLSFMWVGFRPPTGENRQLRHSVVKQRTCLCMTLHLRWRAMFLSQLLGSYV